MLLRERIEALAARPEGQFSAEDRSLFDEFKTALNRGEIRAAERDSDGTWRANSWVKQGILLGFRMGQLADMSASPNLRFFDKDSYPARPTTMADNIRIVPGGSSIRDGAYVAPGVVCMPLGSGGFRVELHLVARMTPLPPLAEMVRDRLERDAARVGLADEPLQVDITFEDIDESCPALSEQLH